MDYGNIFSTINWTVDRPDPDKPNHRFLSHQHGDRKYIAYFKPNDEKQGPICANEYLCAKLAETLGLNCAKVQLFILREEGLEKPGIISHWVHGSNRWVDAIGRDQLNDCSEFAKLFCFDIWVGHQDRSANNLLQTKTNDKYNLYLIDHESCLIGHSDESQVEQDHGNLNCSSHIALPNPKSLVKLDELNNMADKISSIADEKISAIVNTFKNGAKDLLTDNQAVYIIDKLNKRKLLLKQQINEWWVN